MAVLLGIDTGALTDTGLERIGDDYRVTRKLAGGKSFTVESGRVEIHAAHVSKGREYGFFRAKEGEQHISRPWAGGHRYYQTGDTLHVTYLDGRLFEAENRRSGAWWRRELRPRDIARFHSVPWRSFRALALPLSIAGFLVWYAAIGGRVGEMLIFMLIMFAIVLNILPSIVGGIARLLTAGDARIEREIQHVSATILGRS